MLVVIAARGAAWTWGLAAGVALLRMLIAWMVGSEVLRDRQLASLLHLLPLRDFAAVLVWLGSFAGNRIAWRGDYFRLKDGKLARVDP
jgi:hypothetical protein